MANPLLEQTSRQCNSWSKAHLGLYLGSLRTLQRRMG
jgi:hypothetical protein